MKLKKMIGRCCLSKFSGMWAAREALFLLFLMTSEVVLKKKKNALLYSQYKEYKKLFEILDEK